MAGYETVSVTTDLTEVSTVGQPGGQPRYPQLYIFSERYADIHGYIAAVVCVWGIIANLANIAVLTRNNMISSTNQILMWLAVADLLTMTSCLPISIHFYILREPGLRFPCTRSQTWIRFMLFHVNFTVVCHTIAIWLTIILAIFRYLYICYPTKGVFLCTMYRAKMSILAVYLLTAIICIPNYLVTAIQSQPLGCHGNATLTNHTCAYCITDRVDQRPLLSISNYWIQAVLVKLIPCILLTILTILLIFAMHAANKTRMALKSLGRKDESDRARDNNRTTAMLLAIVGLFLLTELPQGILTMVSIFVKTFYTDVYMPLGDLVDIMALLNNSINFVLYCTMSRQFRNTFVKVFCACCEHRPGWLKVKTVTESANGSTSQATKV